MSRNQYSMHFSKGVLTLALILVAIFSFAQDVILENQSEVDAFDQSITVINGNLTIERPENTPSGDIMDLSNLSNITRVKGDVLIARNDMLINLSGLENLSHVEGELIIDENIQMTI